MDEIGKLDLQGDEIRTEDMDMENDILHAMNASEADTKYTINVSRVLGASKLGAKEPFLFGGDASLLLPDLQQKLLSDYGTGTYRIRILKNLRFWRKFDIAVEKQAAPLNAPPAETKTELAGMAQVLAQMQASNQAFMERMLERMETRNVPLVPTPPVDPFVMMERFASIMGNLRGNAPDPTAMIGIFQKGIEIASQMQGGEKETGFMDLAKDLIASIGPALAGGALQPKQIAAPPNPMSPAEQMPSVPADTFTPEMLVAQIAFLVDKASVNRNPDLYAELLLDELPDELLGKFLWQSDIIQQLAQLNPGVNKYKTWFDKLLSSMREQAKNDPVFAGLRPATPGAAPVESPAETK